MNGNGDHGILKGGDTWYKVTLYYTEVPLWATEPPTARKVCFLCVGHQWDSGACWTLHNACPDQPLPPRQHKERNQPSVCDLLRQELAIVSGKDIRGVSHDKIERPEKGPGSFWRSVEDLGAEGKYYEAVMGNGASSAEERKKVEHPPLDGQRA